MKFKFKSEVWLYPGETAAWHFITVPKAESAKIKAAQKGKRRGWGAVRVEATIGQTSWQTSVFPDKKSGCYLLPLKSTVRKSEGIVAKDMVVVTLKIQS